MPSNKLSSRRGTPVRPHVCHPPPRPGGPTTWISPPEVYFYPYQAFPVSGYCCAPDAGDIRLPCSFSCSAGSWSNTPPNARNCTAEAQGVWTAPFNGSCTYTISWVYPDGRRGSATGIATGTV